MEQGKAVKMAKGVCLRGNVKVNAMCLALCLFKHVPVRASERSLSLFATQEHGVAMKYLELFHLRWRQVYS